MPPRYAYWTILAGGLPTAFRAADRDELMPTFHRLREKHPDAQMKWFARGRLWDSPEQARQEGERRRDLARGETRTADWRPGGTHRDPRQKFKDAKKARNIERRHSRFERKHTDAPVEKPHGDKLLRPPRQSKHAPRPSGERRDWQNREQRPDRENRDQRRDWRDREHPPREKPHGDPLTRPPGRENRSHNERSATQTKRSDTRPPGARPFRPRNRVERNQHPDEAAPPPRPAGPNREPPPGKRSEPTPPPRTSEPTVLPPGPPERGRAPNERPRRDRGRR